MMVALCYSPWRAYVTQARYRVESLRTQPFFFASYRGTSRAFAASFTRSHTRVCSLVRSLQKRDLRARYFAKTFWHTLFITQLR